MKIAVVGTGLFAPAPAVGWLWLAVLFTGSKAGLLCAVALPLGLAMLSAVRARQANPYTLVAATLALAVTAVALALPLTQEFLDD